MPNLRTNMCPVCEATFSQKVRAGRPALLCSEACRVRVRLARKQLAVAKDYASREPARRFAMIDYRVNAGLPPLEAA